MTSRVVWFESCHHGRRREWRCWWRHGEHGMPSPRHQPMSPQRSQELLLAAVGRNTLTAISHIYRQTYLSPPCWMNGESSAIAWLKAACTSRVLVGFDVLPAMEGDDLKLYAGMHGINLGMALPVTALEPVTLPNPPANPPIAFKGANSDQKLPTELSDTCPAMNYRSESVETAHPEVITWLKKHIPDPSIRRMNVGEDEWGKTLGYEGDGGFLATTTRVKKLPEKTILYRYASEKGRNGCWWFPQPMSGDPRVFGALPDNSPAPLLFVVITTKEIEILTGLGAPRCSNKPGGPIQYCLSYRDKSTALSPVTEFNSIL